jgi:hypothetical protein
MKVKFLIVLLLGLSLWACSEKKEDGDAATSEAKDKELQEYKLDVAKQQAKNRFPGDTLALRDFVKDNYPAGTYLVEFDRTVTYNIPKSAVVYYKADRNYIFAVIAKSKPGERNIETKNVTGYESSFINLDSTKLGTAFFWLSLFSYDKDGNFSRIWESEVPIHGGFNSMKLKKWDPKGTLYVELNFEDGIISGHRNYNFFMVDGLTNPPHLLETMVGIVHKRVLADVNKDKFPDYVEYQFNTTKWKLDSLYTVRIIDSIPFYWNVKRQLYVNDRNKRWFRKY